MRILTSLGTCVTTKKSTEPLKYEMPLSFMSNNEIPCVKNLD